MKVIFEIPVKEEASVKPSFTWLNNKNNWLFIIEDKKFMKTISIDPDNMKEKQVQSTTVADKRICTSSAWNRDGSVLAMVLDKKQIYFWDIGTNSFTHFKPKSRFSTSTDNKGSKIDLIAWSNVTNKLAICYQTSQILLCNCDSNWYEKFIDKSEGVLSRVKTIEVAECLDQFACITIDSELLIMSFEGELIYYIQLDDSQILKAKCSPPSRSATIKESKSHHLKGDGSYWLAYQSNNNQLYFKELDLQSKARSNAPRKTDMVYCSQETQGSLIDFHWLGTTQLLLCHSIGTITLLKIGGYVEVHHKLDFNLITELILLINKVEDDSDQKDDSQMFRSFELKRYKTTNILQARQTTSITLAAMSDYKIFYFELADVNEHQINYNCSFEKVDDLDLTVNLKKINQKLVRAEWCHDCSMLAIQLTNGHILVYRTRLHDYNVVSHESRIAYLSGSCEITVLNYGSHKLTWSEEVDFNKTSPSPTSLSSQEQEAGEALTISLEFQPSVMAIGPKHLAVALNNRVRFYSLQSKKSDKQKGSLIGEQEYISIVVSLNLNSRFTAIQFQDGRLKLQPILRRPVTSATFVDEGNNIEDISTSLNSSEDDESLDERFFPDPTHPERISSFALTEDLLIYTSLELQLNVFNLSLWSIVQVCKHSLQFDRPILKLRPNGCGNKFVCLLSPKMVTTSELQTNNVYLYDLYTNSMISFKANKLYRRMFDSQLSPSLAPPAAVRLGTDKGEKETIVVWPKLNQVLDAIWDTDGRSLLLIERKRIHMMVVLDHTLERETPIVEHVYTGQKPASYTTLYASQGIVSFQTAVGRVINSTLDSHNDVERLNRLVLQIKELKDEVATFPVALKVQNQMDDLEVQKRKVLMLKLDYLRSILPIYSLTKCKEICLHLMSDELFNLNKTDRDLELEVVLWKQLAIWALYTQNLKFALFIYRRHKLLVFARVLEQIIDDARHRSLDAKTSVKTRLLVMLDCDISDCSDTGGEGNESTGEGRGFY